MTNIETHDFSTNEVDSSNKVLVPHQIEEFIEHALALQKNAGSNNERLTQIESLKSRLLEYDKEIEENKQLEEALKQEIKLKKVGKNKIQLRLQEIFGDTLEEESLEVVEGGRYSQEWHRKRTQEQINSHNEALLAFQESIITNENVASIIEKIREEAQIIQRIAKGICIGRQLNAKDLDSFKSNPNEFLDDLAEKVKSGNVPAFEIQTEDYNAANEIYDRLLTYIGKTISKNRVFEAESSTNVQSDFIRPRTHLVEGISSIVETDTDKSS